MQPILDSELILNPDGSIYHLNLHPEQVAPTVITVGDPDRVAAVSKYFDKIDHQVQKREFVTHTGWIGKKRLTVISTGIGTGNIDIVFNELDALFNVDLASKTPKKTSSQLQFIRIGTSGCLKKNIPLDTFLVSEFAVGMDNLLTYYEYLPTIAEQNLQNRLQHFLKTTDEETLNIPYVCASNEALVNKLGRGFQKGITLTCPGFYGPQGRQLRARIKASKFLDYFVHFNQHNFQFQQKKNTFDWKITNFEMETAAIYGLANILGHQAISFNALLANRETGAFSKNPKETVDRLIVKVVELISEN
ncbi:MAG: nucleoside phosphorylase [Bacteroidota bacterium]